MSQLSSSIFNALLMMRGLTRHLSLVMLLLR
jgi:hypothetical protein